MRKQFKELISHSSVYSIGTISESAVLVFFLPLLTTYLSPEQFGLVALAQLATTLCVKLTAPFTSALNRFYYNPDFREKRLILIWNLLYILFLKTVVLFFLFLISSGLITQLIGDSQNNVQPLIIAFAFVLLLQPVESFIKIFYRLEQKALFFAIVSFSQVIVYCVTLILSLGIFDLGILAVPISISVRVACGLLCFLPVFLRFLTFQFKPGLTKEPLSYGYPLILSAYSNYLLQSGDRIILKMFCPLALVGMYDVGYRIASIINFLFTTPMKQALHPIAFQQEAQPEKQKYFLRRSATVYYGVALLFGLVLALFSREMVMLLARKESYHAVWVIVPLIIFGYVQHGLGNFLGVGMVMAKKATYQSGILVVTALINIGLNFILIPYIDIWGAAIATVAAYIVWNYLKALYSWKFYGLSFEAKRLYLLSFLWVVFVLAGLLILFPSLYLTILFRLVLIALFPVIVFFSGFLNTDEKEFVLQLFKKTLQRRTCKTRT